MMDNVEKKARLETKERKKLEWELRWDALELEIVRVMDILMKYEMNKMEVEENGDDTMDYEDWEYNIDIEMAEEEEYEDWLARELEGMGITWSLDEVLEPMEEGVMGVGSKPYPLHHGGVYTPLQNMPTITVKGMEIDDVIGGHTTEGNWAGNTEHTLGVGPTEIIMCTGVQQATLVTDSRKVISYKESPKLSLFFTENNP